MFGWTKFLENKFLKIEESEFLNKVGKTSSIRDIRCLLYPPSPHPPYAHQPLPLDLPPTHPPSRPHSSPQPPL